MSAAQLTVAVDVRHPHVWFGVPATHRLAADTGVELRWRPLRVRLPQPPVDPGPAASRGERHRYLRAMDFERNLVRYAAASGITPAPGWRNANGDIAAAALLWLDRQAPERVDAWLADILPRCWSASLDLSSARAVAATVAAVGAPTAGLVDWLGGDAADEVAACESELRAAGVFDVPGYLLNDEPFLGRQHLPMLRWLIGGRVGPPPI